MEIGEKLKVANGEVCSKIWRGRVEKVVKSNGETSSNKSTKFG